MSACFGSFGFFSFVAAQRMHAGATHPSLEVPPSFCVGFVKSKSKAMVSILCTLVTASTRRHLAGCAVRWCARWVTVQLTDFSCHNICLVFTAMLVSFLSGLGAGDCVGSVL